MKENYKKKLQIFLSGIKVQWIMKTD